MEILKIADKAFPKLQPKKRVAAYARVSLETELLLHSLSVQVEYFKEYIQANPEWEYAGTYVDEGLSGRSMEKRKGLKRLLADCETGQIDMLIVKSISRFARDTLDCLNITRHLKELGINVHFEKEGINSISPDGELLLTLMASFAQEESRSISENVRWATRKRFEEGLPNGHKALFGYMWDGEKYRIIPEQGEVVKEIFASYLAGDSAYKIAKQLRGKGITGLTGSLFEQTTVKDILSNISYTGSMMLQKKYITENRKVKKNKGELPMYLVSDMLEPLISEEDFNKVQQLRKERAAACANKDYVPTMFSGILQCGKCGAGVSRRSPRTGKKWSCNTKERKGKAVCDCRSVMEKDLIASTAKVLGNTNFTPDEFKSKVKCIIVRQDRLEYKLSNGKSMDIHLAYKTFTSKVWCGQCGAKCRLYTHKGIRAWRCSCNKTECGLINLKEAELLEACEKSLGIDFCEKLTKVIISNEQIKVTSREDGEKAWQRK